MKHLHFAKMHGLGNDFLVLDGINQTINPTPPWISTLANRHTGIGFDQCLLLEKSESDKVDFNYRIFNADGQEVGQCGNGARCLALFIKHFKLSPKNELNIATKTTQMHLRLNDNHSISVNLNTPKLAPCDIPLLEDKQAKEYSLRLSNNQIVNIHAINVGNPHAVLVVPNVEEAPVATLGPEISHHPRFPEQTNAGFMQLIDSNHIKCRVYERGAGETLACGSGAVAAAAIARLYYGLSEHITVSLPGGDLQVNWPELNGPITLTGPAVLVYEGKLML